MPSKVLNFLKQAPWLVLFWLIMILSVVLWGMIMGTSRLGQASYPGGLDYETIMNLNGLYYTVLIPLAAAGITYVSVRLNGFSLLFLFLLPLINYWTGLTWIWQTLEFIKESAGFFVSRTLVNSILRMFQEYNQLVLVALGASLLAQHHRERKLQQKEVLARD